MSQPTPTPTNRASRVVDAVLVIGFFFYMYSVLASHVPSTNPSMVLLWGGLTSALMAALFWVALQMFRVVLRFQREQRAASREK
ncbi:hypothetical protein [Opitutus sp. ER46]|uniref:hypothetical protein n=1 Tax=Opitutus sp. ER46 TaxID=2161864 RepID=UPI000D30BAB6|nr:hypothetical protein [Opitutus sp. ER46]PTX96440.1 hypothetical protein DB354_07190 [Opitutus sp. ER46]